MRGRKECVMRDGRNAPTICGRIFARQRNARRRSVMDSFPALFGKLETLKRSKNNWSERMDVRERCPEGVFAKARDLQLRDHVTFSNEFPRGVLSQFIRL